MLKTENMGDRWFRWFFLCNQKYFLRNEVSNMIILTLQSLLLFTVDLIFSTSFYRSVIMKYEISVLQHYICIINYYKTLHLYYKYIISSTQHLVASSGLHSRDLWYLCTYQQPWNWNIQNFTDREEKNAGNVKINQKLWNSV